MAMLKLLLEKVDKSTDGDSVGSLMHDIGKIGTPDRILFKPGKHDGEEWLQIQNRCEVGVSILKDAPDG